MAKNDRARDGAGDQDQAAQDQTGDAAAQAAADEGLVTVWKEGVELDVHPSCVAAHVAAGWKVRAA